MAIIQNLNNRLKELEYIIQKFESKFYDLGKALIEIKEGYLFKDLGFKTFEQYVTQRLDMTRSHAYRMINASKVIDNLSPIGDKLPQNESQARPLTKFDAFNQRKLWRIFLKTKMPITTSNIYKCISVENNSQNVIPVRIDIISDDYKLKVNDMIHQIRLEQNSNWENTSKEAALYWNKIMKEKILWEI